MPRINTIFFDWGGVIANDPGDDFLAMLLREIGATELQVEEIFDTYMQRFMRGELTKPQYWQELQKKYGLTIHDSISDEFKRWKGLQKNDEIFALVGWARKKGFKTVLLTNVIEPTYNMIERTGYYDAFDAVIASFQVGSRKPEKMIYEFALNKMDTTAEQSLFIDDKPSNLEPAEEMGFTTILARSPEQIIADLKSYISKGAATQL